MNGILCSVVSFESSTFIFIFFQFSWPIVDLSDDGTHITKELRLSKDVMDENTNMDLEAHFQNPENARKYMDAWKLTREKEDPHSLLDIQRREVDTEWPAPEQLVIQHGFSKLSQRTLLMQQKPLQSDSTSSFRYSDEITNKTMITRQRLLNMNHDQRGKSTRHIAEDSRVLDKSKNRRTSQHLRNNWLPQPIEPRINTNAFKEECW